jgi:CheY-like chemotaxis protein
MLQLEGHHVTSVVDGRAALRAMLPGVPDLLLIDTRLPDVSGLEVVRAMRKAHRGEEVAVIVLTDDPVRASAPAEELAVARVVTKPVSLLDLADLLREYTPERWSREPPSPTLSPAEPVRRAPTPPPVAHVPPPPVAQVAAPPVSRAPSPLAPPAQVAGVPASVAVRAAMSAGRVLPPPASSQAAVAQLTTRLRREAKLVEEADAWTVLSVPRRSPASLVAKAVERARERYGPLARDASPEVSALARKILECVESAAEETGLDLALAMEDDGLTEGRVLLERSDWTAADAFFDAARNARPDSAAAMAGLGWARFNNPKLQQLARESDGLALIELALTFDPGQADAWFFLANVALRRGDRAGALTHVSRALRLDPVHNAAATLLRELRAAPVPAQGS